MGLQAEMMNDQMDMVMDKGDEDAEGNEVYN